MRDEALGIQPELIDRCSRFLDGSCPFRAFVCQEVVELLRRSDPDIDAALRESLAHVGCVDGAVDMGVCYDRVPTTERVAPWRKVNLSPLRR